MNSNRNITRISSKLVMLLSLSLMTMAYSVTAQSDKGQRLKSEPNSLSQELPFDLMQPPIESILFKNLQMENASFIEEVEAEGPVFDLLCYVACKAAGGGVDFCRAFCRGNPVPH